MNEGQSFRRERVADRIRDELMNMLIRGVLRDPRLRDVCVTRVEVSADLRNAYIFVRTTADEVAAETRTGVVRALQSAGGFVRRELAPRLGLRYQPVLKFAWDDALEETRRVDALLQEIKDGEPDAS
jgi:ribosome-binding factor A